MKKYLNKYSLSSRHSGNLLAGIHGSVNTQISGITSILSVKNILFFTLAISCLYLAQAHASDEIPGNKQTHPIALTGGTVHTVSGETLVNATLLFDNGKITAIGSTMTLSDSTEKIDISGKHVYPGLIAANSRVGLVEIDAVRSTQDYAEVTQIKPNVRVESALNPDSELLPVLRANGITMTHTIPMGGLSAVPQRW